MDNGSHRSFILREVVEAMQLDVIGEETVAMTPFGATSPITRTHQKVRVKLNETNGHRFVELECLVVEAIGPRSESFPLVPLDVAAIAKKIGCRLADDEGETQPSPIQVLLGTDVIGRVQVLETPKQLMPGLIARATIFGWVLSGSVGSPTDNAVCMRVLKADLPDVCRIERIGVGSKDLMADPEVDVLKEFDKSVVYEDHHDVVAVPTRESGSELNKQLRASFYMDDLGTGAVDEEEAEDLKQTATTLVLAAGTRLEDWAANASGVNATEEVSDVLCIASDKKEDELCGRLDHLLVDHFQAPAAKRSLISSAERNYDPLSGLGSLICRAKLLFQDSPSETDLNIELQRWIAELPERSTVNETRFLTGKNTWRNYPGTLNRADLAMHGISAEQVSKEDRWYVWVEMFTR